MWTSLFVLARQCHRGLYYISHTLDDDESGKSLQTRHWKELKPFIFRSGKTTPPPLLRAVPEQNYLSKASRITGLFLMSFVMFACIVSAIWLVVNRKERIIKASQPSFMYAICFGSFVEALAILPVSFDESYGLTEEHLDIACMSVPWLIAVGHMITYGALFSKVRHIMDMGRCYFLCRHSHTSSCGASIEYCSFGAE
jgi:hypothetical protein